MTVADPTETPPSEAPAPSPGVALAALARKYRTLAALRRAKARGEPPPERAYFRALAAEFPGVLRELDTLLLSELDARAEALERAAAAPADGAVEPWMLWLRDYHVWLRVALWVKRRVARQADVSHADAARVSHAAGERLGLVVEPGFVRAIAAPPGGRMRPVVLARVAALHGADVHAITVVLLPTLRASRDEG